MTQMISKEQARRFMLARQGLLDAGRFKGAEGLMDYVRMVGCVQFDPVDVCGRSHELAFLSRVEGFTPDMLTELLYGSRRLIDFFDKNMCLMRVEDWPYLEFNRAYYRDHSRGREAVDEVAPAILARLHELGCATSQELNMKQRVDWYWSATTLGRAALETLYFRGELVVHHKLGSVKSYALASDCLPEALLRAPCPLATAQDRHMWQLKRRIGAVGLLANGPSDAWLGVDGFKAQERSAAFARLEGAGEIVPVAVEDVKKPLYALAGELPALEAAAKPFTGAKRARFLAPLDCMLWDRRLINELFGFDYKWEIYTPAEQRKYAHYTLPVLYGERFAGRVEPVCDRKAKVLRMKRFWPEAGVRRTDALDRAIARAAEELRAFHGLERVAWGADGADVPSGSFWIK